MAYEVFILLGLFLKHHILDFEYQPPFQWKNKGTYGHLGGILHSLQHIIGTLCVIFLSHALFYSNFNIVTISAILTAEFFIHYHMDWFKMWWNKKKEYGPLTHEEFWYWIGRDQLVHNLTYIGIFLYITSLPTG